MTSGEHWDKLGVQAEKRPEKGARETLPLPPPRGWSTDFCWGLGGVAGHWGQGEGLGLWLKVLLFQGCLPPCVVCLDTPQRAGMSAEAYHRPPEAPRKRPDLQHLTHTC